MIQNRSRKWLEKAGAKLPGIEYMWVGKGEWLKNFIHNVPSFNRFFDCVCVKFDKNGGFVFRVMSCGADMSYVCQLN